MLLGEKKNWYKIISAIKKEEQGTKLRDDLTKLPKFFKKKEIREEVRKRVEKYR